MTDSSSSSWWKLTFLRRQKSQPKVLYEDFVQHGSEAASGAAAHAEVSVHGSQLDARLERIVDKTAASRGRHVKVSNSGRFKEKKKVRTTLAENPEMFTSGAHHPDTDEKQRVKK